MGSIQIKRNFPLLCQIVTELLPIEDYEGTSLLTSLRPQDVDGLAREFGDIFETVVKLLIQSPLPQIQKDQCNHLMHIVCVIVVKIAHEGKGNDNFLALLTLLLKTVATPINFNTLLRIMDADVGIGSMRCDAILIMNKLIYNADLSIWSMKLGHDGQQHFTTEYMKVLGKILHDQATRSDSILHFYSLPDDIYDKRCKCFCMERGVWQSTSRALKMTKDDPFTIINILDNIDWTSILESDEAPINMGKGSTSHPKYFYDTSIADTLTMHAINVLLIDKDNSKARNLYRKVGRSQKLFHHVLKRIITAEIYSLPLEISDPIMIFTDLSALGSYIQNCVLLAPHSSCIDDTTNRLVDCAQSTLQRVFNMPKIQSFLKDTSQPFPSKNEIVTVLSNLSSSELACVTTRTEEDLFEHIVNNYRDSTIKRQQDGLRKVTRKVYREAQEKGDIKIFDMCANCFVTDTDLKKEGRALLKCTSCKQVTYCNRHCQKKHWKKHQKTCKN